MSPFSVRLGKIAGGGIIVPSSLAARSAAEAAIALAKDAEGLFVIAAGAGNNGGDGFACARSGRNNKKSTRHDAYS